MPAAKKSTILGRRSTQDSASFVRLNAENVRLPNGEMISSFCQLILEGFGVVVGKSENGHSLFLKQYKQDEDSAKAGLPKFFLDPPKECFEEEGVVLTRMEGLNPAQDSKSLLSFNHASAISLTLTAESGPV